MVLYIPEQGNLIICRLQVDTWKGECKIMQYAIELFFNEEMEKELFHYAQRIAEEKLSTKYLEWKIRLRITLACVHDVDEKACTETIKLFAGLWLNCCRNLYKKRGKY